jgi:hypothetical protein
MNAKRANTIFLIGLGILSWMAPRATADESDQKTIFTFSDSVQIPGQVLEPAASIKEAHVAAMRQARLKAQKPTGEESDISEMFAAPK